MTSTILVEKKKLENPPLEIHYLGDRVLRQPAKRISRVDDEIGTLIRGTNPPSTKCQHSLGFGVVTAATAGEVIGAA